MKCIMRKSFRTTLAVLTIATSCFCSSAKHKPPSTASSSDTARQCDSFATISSHPSIPPGFLLGHVIENKFWLVNGWCPEQVVLLDMTSTVGLEKEDVAALQAHLEEAGCTVIQNTKDAYDSYLNPNKDDWIRNHLLGAVYSSVSSCFDENGDIALSIGYYKGTLTLRSITLFFTWNGQHWVEAKYRHLEIAFNLTTPIWTPPGVPAERGR